MFKRKSFSWTLAYFILLVVFVISVVLMFLFNNAVTKKVNKEYCNLLFDEISFNAIDVLENSNQMYSVLIKHEGLDEILKVDKINDYYKNDAVFDLIDRLTSVKKDLDFYIFFPKTDTVASQSGFFSSWVYYESYIKKYNVSYEEWIENLHGESTSKALPLNSSDGREIFLSEKILKSKQHIYLVTKIDEQSMFNVGAFSDWGELVDIYISDLNGNLYMSKSNHEKADGLSYIKDIKSSYDDEWEVFERMEYSILPMTVTIVYRKDLTLAEVSAYNRLQAILCAFLILLNAWLVLYMLKRHRKSIGSIMKLFGIKNTKKGLKGIEENVGAILKINSDYSNQIKKATATKENLILEKCLSGVYPKSKIGKVLKEAGIEFNHKHFVLCAFKIEKLDDFYGDNSEDLSLEEKFDDLTFIFQNVFAELFFPYECYVRIVRVEERIIAIINMDDEIHYNCRTVNDVLHQGTDFINENFLLECTFVTTALFSEVGQLAENYAQAIHLLRYKDVMGIDGDLELMVGGDRDKTYFETILNCDTEQKIINYITASDFESAKFLIEHIFSRLAEQRMTFEQRQCAMIDLGCMLYKVPKKGIELDFSEILSNSINIDTMKEYLYKVIEKMCMSITPSDLKNEKLASVKNYIDTKYYEGLDLNSLSDIFGISQNYLSSSFKKEFNISIPEYINKVRIRNAKQLFKNSDKSVKEVAERVGFTNVSTFDRIFKKYEGITPTAFKNNVR